MHLYFSSEDNTLTVRYFDTEAEASIIQPPDVKNQLTGKDLDAGKIGDRRRKGQCG